MGHLQLLLDKMGLDEMGINHSVDKKTKQNGVK